MEKIQLRHKTFEQITYYKVGAGPILLLVHGFPANVQLWRLVLPEISKHYTVLLPNFFENVGDWLMNGETSMTALAEGFNDILEHEKAEKILFAGHSMGGYMGLAFATKYPDKILGLSLIHSSALGDDTARAEGRRKTVSILENGGKSPFLKKMVRALFTDEFNTQNPEMLARQTEEAIAVNDQSLVAFYKAIMERNDTTTIVRGANFPVQNIVGKKDTLANITKELAAENLASINFVSVYEDTGHMAMLENPECVTNDLLHFLDYCYRQ